jgi:O-antigen/teichoic acid export membrane protein
VREGGVARASLFVLLGKLGGNLGLFAGALVLARALNPADRGGIAFITTTALVFGVISAAGLREASTVFLARESERRAQLIGNSLSFGTFFALVAAVVVCGVLALVPQLHPADVTRLDVLILGAGILGVALENSGYAMNLGLSHFRQMAILQTTYAWAYAVGLALVWRFGELTITRAALIWVGAQILGGVILIAAVLRRTNMGRPSILLFREEWRFGSRAWIGSLSAFLGFRLDQMIMGVISTETALGIYAVAVNGSEVELYVPQSVANGLLPVIVQTSAEARAERTLRVFRLVSLATLVGAAVAFTAGPFLVPAVFGAAFRPSVGPFLWLVGGGLGFVANSIFSAALMASDAPWKASLGPFAALIVGTVLDFVLIPSHGATGAAIAAAAGFFAGGTAAALAFARTYPVQWRLVVPSRADLAEVSGALRRTRA